MGSRPGHLPARPGRGASRTDGVHQALLGRWHTRDMAQRRPSTLSEVARRAGVSVATASKALNGRARVAEDTRARVVQASEDLAFTPNPVARSLFTGRTRTVGMLIRDTNVERFALPLMLGAEDALTGIDLSLVVSDARGDRGRTDAMLRMLSQRKVDGVLIVGANTKIRSSVTHLMDVPVIYVYGESADPADISHMPDDFGGAVQTVDHVVAAGRRRIAHLTGPRTSRAVQQRVEGIRSALRNHNMRLTGPVVYGRWSQRWGREAGAELLRRNPLVDAVLCGSDQIAAGIVDALLDSGRRVPEDVAVTGYDNWVEFAGETDPLLTTVDMNLEALGAAAAHELFDAIDGRPAPGGVRRHPCTLLVRGSTPTAPRSATRPHDGAAP